MLPQTHMRTEHIQHTTRELRPYLPTVEVRPLGENAVFEDMKQEDEKGWSR